MEIQKTYWKFSRQSNQTKPNDKSNNDVETISALSLVVVGGVDASRECLRPVTIFGEDPIFLAATLRYIATIASRR
jgi:hypothetical protein